MWNMIRMATHSRRKSYADISIESLENHFSNKFSGCQNTRYVQTCFTKIERNFKKLEKVAECVSVNNSRIKMYIERLKPGCAAGVDGISSEHLKYALDCPELIYHLCVLLTLCLRYRVLPNSFRKGILVSLLKKPTIDPALANIYRPVVISTFPKVLEMYILEESGYHDFADSQFGFSMVETQV